MGSKALLLKECVSLLSGNVDSVDLYRVSNAVAGSHLLSEVPSNASARERSEQDSALKAWCSAVSRILTSRGTSSAVLGAQLVLLSVQQCSTARLLQNYASWGTAMALSMKELAVGIAFDGACDSVRAIIERMEYLLDVPGCRKEVSSHSRPRPLRARTLYSM